MNNTATVAPVHIIGGTFEDDFEPENDQPLVLEPRQQGFLGTIFFNSSVADTIVDFISSAAGAVGGIAQEVGKSWIETSKPGPKTAEEAKEEQNETIRKQQFMDVLRKAPRYEAKVVITNQGPVSKDQVLNTLGLQAAMDISNLIGADGRLAASYETQLDASTEKQRKADKDSRIALATGGVSAKDRFIHGKYASELKGAGGHTSSDAVG